MPKFAANLSMMFNEWDFLDRFAAAADTGFSAVEFLFPYAHAPDEVARRLQASGLTQALFNLPPGDWDKGERGMASVPGREAEFRASVETALPYAKATGVKRLHVMSGHGDRHDPRAVDRRYHHGACPVPNREAWRAEGAASARRSRAIPKER